MLVKSPPQTSNVKMSLQLIVRVSLLVVLEGCVIGQVGSIHMQERVGARVILRLKGGMEQTSGSVPLRVGSFAPKIERSKSTLWFEGYKAGRMQFLQSYIPDHRDGKSLVVGLAGGTGSGKTTIKDTILEQLVQEGGGATPALGGVAEAADNVAVLSHDNYYKHRPDLSDEERDKINFDHPDSLDTLLLVQHLQELIDGKAVECPVYDFATHLRKEHETIRVEPRPIILVDGILIFCDKALRELMNLRIYVDVEADRRILRRIRRDLVQRGRSFDSIVSQYLETVKPMHDRFVEPSKQYADLIVPFGGRNVAAIQVLLEKLKSHLRNNFAYLNSQAHQETVFDSDGKIQQVDYHSEPRSKNSPVYESQRTSDDIKLPYEKTSEEEAKQQAGSYAL